MQNLHSESEALEILTSHLDGIRGLMIESLAELNKAMSVISVSTNTRAKCSLLHSIAVEKAVRHFAGKPGIQLVKKYQSIQIIFKGQLIGRIKQVNQHNLSRNARTGRNDIIIAQDNTLFGDIPIPKMTFIDFGYKVDFIWSKFEKLVVVCRVKDSVNWFIPLDLTNESIVPMSSGKDLQFKDEKIITLKKAE